MSASHKHHSGDDPNNTAKRIKHATNESFARTIPEKHVFGTEDEIVHRVGGTISSLPDRFPTTFKQMGPESAGGNMNDHRPRKYAGNQKFGNPRRYA